MSTTTSKDSNRVTAKSLVSLYHKREINTSDLTQHSQNSSLVESIVLHDPCHEIDALLSITKGVVFGHSIFKEAIVKKINTHEVGKALLINHESDTIYYAISRGLMSFKILKQSLAEIIKTHPDLSLSFYILKEVSELVKNKGVDTSRAYTLHRRIRHDEVGTNFINFKKAQKWILAAINSSEVNDALNHRRENPPAGNIETLPFTAHKLVNAGWVYELNLNRWLLATPGFHPSLLEPQRHKRRIYRETIY